jgi:RNA-splicing ligase RtcB
VILDIENHHNFAWKETHVVNGEEREVIVHRKGATPADFTGKTVNTEGTPSPALSL